MWNPKHLVFLSIFYLWDIIWYLRVWGYLIVGKIN